MVENIPRHQQEVWLRQQMTAGLSQRDIAKLAGVSKPTIRSWMLKFGIEQRTISESLLVKSDQVSASAKAVWADQERRKRQSAKLKAWEPEFCDLDSLNTRLLALLDRPKLT